MSHNIDICFTENQDGTTAVISNWLKKPGDPVSANEPVAEVETDKVVVEVSAPSDGHLASIAKQNGDAVEPGDVLGIISTGQLDYLIDNQELEATQSPPESAPMETNGHTRPKLSPAVRRLLKEHNLDFQQLSGSGRGGRITVKDVTHFVESKPSTFVPPMGTVPEGNIRSHRLPLDPMRKSIAAHMVQSLLHTSPHVTTVFEADLSRIIAHRKKHKPDFKEQGINLTLSAYFVEAAVHAIRQVPTVNSRFAEDHIEIFDDINIGIATALDDKGLVVPVLQQAHAKNLLGIAQDLQNITDKARSRKLGTADMRNGTFTISNHGVSGSLMASPIIINQPQSAILGIGKMEKRVVVQEVDGNDAMIIKPMCFITLTLDHRVLDAYQANGFLSELVGFLENYGS
ncbi:MAG: 2-oxo acid dehydrogenase subunit E2 [Pseudomonadota bacterium]